jgi:hypothetical protein
MRKNEKKGTGYFFSSLARLRLYGEKTVRKAERALRGAKRRSNLSNNERRAKP